MPTVAATTFPLRFGLGLKTAARSRRCGISSRRLSGPTTTVTFHVGDPNYYGQKRRMEVSASNVYVNAGGNRPAYLKVTAKPAAGSTWRITNVDTGEFVAINAALTSSSTIRLDMATEHATVNNQTAPVTIDSDYFEINGRCHLNITSGTAVLEWVERWL